MKTITYSAFLSLAVFCGSVAHADDAALVSSATSANIATVAAPTTVVAAEAATAEVFDPDAPRLNTEITRSRYPNVPLLATGSTLLAASYLPAVVGAAISDREGDDHMYIPVAGPWMTLARGEEERRGYKALLVADGVLQGIGGLAMLGSFLIPEERTRTWRLFGQSASVKITPQMAWHSVGLGAHARF